MGATRKLQGEIDRVLKKVTEGVDVFDGIWNKARLRTPRTRRITLLSTTIFHAELTALELEVLGSRTAGGECDLHLLEHRQLTAGSDSWHGRVENQENRDQILHLRLCGLFVTVCPNIVGMSWVYSGYI